MQIDWWTLGLQTINFLVLVWLLQRFLYHPVKDVIEKRRQLAEEALAEAGSKEAEAVAAKETFEQARAQLADERRAMLTSMHKELEAEREKVLAKAQGDAGKLIETAGQAIAEERQAASSELRRQTAGLAVEVAAELLRKVGSGALDDACLGRLYDQLETMAPDEVDRLKKDLLDAKAPLTVVTAAPLSDEAERIWQGRLGHILGNDGQTRFETKSALVGGAELRFPHAVLTYTLADQLKVAEELLRRDDIAS